VEEDVRKPLTITEVLREMREYGADGGSGYNPDIVYVWADAIEAAMQTPVAHSHRLLPEGGTKKTPLYALPPDAAGEIERLHEIMRQDTAKRNRYLAEIERLREPKAYISHTSQGDVLDWEPQFDAPSRTKLYALPPDAAGEIERLRKALLNVSVHTAHANMAPDQLHVDLLLERISEITRAALAREEKKDA